MAEAVNEPSPNHGPGSLAVLHVGDCRLWVRSHELHAPGREPQRLPKRLVELLVLLATHANKVLARQELLDGLWQRRMVADEVLSRAIADLRLALGDDARSPRYIETIPKTGYRLIARVQFLSNDGPVVADDASQDTLAIKPHHEPTSDRSALSESSDEAASIPANVRSLAPHRWRPGTPWALATCVILLILALLVAAWRETDTRIDTASLAELQQRLSRALPLSSDAQWELDPATSSDGIWLAYARSDPFSMSRDIYLRHLPSGKVQAWTNETGSNDSPAFSPDASELVYRHCSREAICEWRRRSLHGGSWRVIADADPGSRGADWSELGIVAVVRNATSQSELAWLPSGEGQSWRTLWTASKSLGQMPRFVPGTRAVAILSDVGLHIGLFRIDLDAPHHVLRVDQWNSRIHDHRWLSADLALVTSDALGFRALLRWHAHQAAELVGARGSRGIALLPNGGAILTVAEYDSNLHQFKLSDLRQPSVPIDVSTRSEGHPALSPDGRWLAMVSLRENSDQIWLKDLQGESLRRVSPIVIPRSAAQRGRTQTINQAVRPAFSHDGQTLYYTVYIDDAVQAWSHDVRRGIDLALPELGTEVFALQPSSMPGVFVYGSHTPEGGLQLWRTTGGAAQGLAREIKGAERVLAFHVDGETLWWQSSAVSGWLGLNLRNDQPLGRSEPAEKRGELNYWTASQGALYALYGDRVLYRSTSDTSSWQALGQLPPGNTIESFSVDAANDRLVAARLDRVEVDLLHVLPAP